MDRSFLSRSEVIAASRKFVCIRLASYENEAENNFCESIFLGRSGEVENTTFAILGPDGKQKLTRAGRSTKSAFADAGQMANAMAEIAGRFPGNSVNQSKPLPLPIALDARLALDIASSDCQPLVVVMAADEKTRLTLETKIAALAWSDEFIGRLVFATAKSAKELTVVKEIPA